MISSTDLIHCKNTKPQNPGQSPVKECHNSAVLLITISLFSFHLSTGWIKFQYGLSITYSLCYFFFKLQPIWDCKIEKPRHSTGFSLPKPQTLHCSYVFLDKEIIYFLVQSINERTAGQYQVSVGRLWEIKHFHLEFIPHLLKRRLFGLTSWISQPGRTSSGLRVFSNGSETKKLQKWMDKGNSGLSSPSLYYLLRLLNQSSGDATEISQVFSPDTSWLY